MENADWSVIKNMPKAGCADEFKEAVKRLLEIMNKSDITWSLMELDTSETVQISRIPRIDAIVEGYIDWLDSVDHLLKRMQKAIVRKPNLL